MNSNINDLIKKITQIMLFAGFFLATTTIVSANNEMRVKSLDIKFNYGNGFGGLAFGKTSRKGTAKGSLVIISEDEKEYKLPVILEIKEGWGLSIMAGSGPAGDATVSDFDGLRIRDILSEYVIYSHNLGLFLGGAGYYYGENEKDVDLSFASWEMFISLNLISRNESVLSYDKEAEKLKNIETILDTVLVDISNE